MNRKNQNLVFCCLLGTFILSFLLLYNSKEHTGMLSSNFKLIKIVNTKFDLLNKSRNLGLNLNLIWIKNANRSEIRNIDAVNFKKLPSYQHISKINFGKGQKQTNASENYGGAKRNMQVYRIAINSKKVIEHIQNSGKNSVIIGADIENFTAQHSENKANEDDNQLSQYVNQTEALNESNLFEKIKGSVVLAKSDQGFISMNTDVIAIESSFNMGNNGMQRSISDIDPGDGGDMGGPLPIGDGWIFLLILSGFYGILKTNTFVITLKSFLNNSNT